MNPPTPEYDRERLLDLVSVTFHGTADDSQRRELTELLREHPEARDEYIEWTDMHALLSTELVVAPVRSAQNSRATNEESSTDPNGLPADRSASTLFRLPPSPWLKTVAVAALAASLLIGLILIANREPATNGPTFGSIAHVSEAVWKARDFQVGDRFGKSTLQLEQGFVRLQLDSGVEVTLQGPAEFELVDMVMTELRSGLLTADVPEGAEGFTVNTPTAEVVDLGTSFGIDLREVGFSKVSVFDGEVEIAPRDVDEKHLLTEGESVRIGVDSEIEDVQFNPGPFAKLWPIASGIKESTESVRFIPPWPRPIRFVQSDEHIFVGAEGHTVRLQNDLMVNVSEPGVVENNSELTPTTLEPGVRVRSYILHYSPLTQLGPKRAQSVNGSITFDRPILGLIVRHEELLASSRRFGRRGAGEFNHRRELSFSGDQAGDRITLSDDRRTLTLDLISPGRSSDLIRVIVDGSGRVPPAMRRKRR